MKISELIEQLEEIRKEHGDMDVFVWPYDGQRAYSPPDKLELFEDEDTREKKDLLISAGI